MGEPVNQQMKQEFSRLHDGCARDREMASSKMACISGFSSTMRCFLFRSPLFSAPFARKWGHSLAQIIEKTTKNSNHRPVGVHQKAMHGHKPSDVSQCGSRFP